MTPHNNASISVKINRDKSLNKFCDCVKIGRVTEIDFLKVIKFSSQFALRFYNCKAAKSYRCENLMFVVYVCTTSLFMKLTTFF